MAEVALTSIAKSALQLFSSLAKDELLLLWNSQEELSKLEATIETIACFLQDGEKLLSKDLSVQNCLFRLRKFMYEADDFFDAMAARALHKKTMSGNAFTKEVRVFFSKSSNQLGFGLEVAHEVKALRESLDEIAKDMDRFSFIKQRNPRVENLKGEGFGREGTHSVVREEDVVGRDTDRDRIVGMLLDSSFSNQSFSVVAIIGFGGLGKTTLAQYVYNSDEVKQGFDVCLWACIKDLANLEKVLIEIIASKEGKKLDLGLEKLQEKLREIVSSKKFLIVLDDVWDEEPTHWLRLEALLRYGKCGSRVLVTTRSVKVAECLGAPESYCVGLDVLSEESAWDLFVKNAFYDGEVSKYPELEPLGRKIAGRCGNVPLAIIVIGRLMLRKEREERRWSDFLENEMESLKSMIDVLVISYNNLDANLKLCFAYCSLFPKGYGFDKDELVCYWLSQGFIEPCRGNKQSLEELGEAYFFHLVDRCFFQGVECNRNKYFCNVHVGNPIYRHSAKMHDLLHDLAVEVAREETIFIDRDAIKRGENGKGARHICISSDVVEPFRYSNLVSDPSIVRTIICEDRRTVRELAGSLKDLTRFRALRTLCLSSMGIHSIPDSIGELVHLRFLDLSSNKLLKHLPSSICKLYHLMTLVLQDCQLLQTLPSKIDRLVSLRHLYIDGCHALECKPKAIRALTSLVSLDRLVVGRRNGGLSYLNELNSLSGGVKIELPEEGWPDAVQDAERSNMSNKHRLRKMSIVYGNDLLPANQAQKMAKDIEKHVLEALEPPQKLEHLKIKNYGGDKLSSWFCMLKHVKELCLSGCDHVEYLEHDLKGGSGLCFPGLKILKLEEMKSLKGWWSRETKLIETNRPSLAKVTHVYIRDCPELKENMPLFVGVEELHLIRVDVKLLELSLPPFDSIAKLKEAKLTEIKGLVCLPEKWISHLTTLQILDIDDCNDLQQVSRRGLGKLAAIKELKLGRCCEIVDEGDEMDQNELGMPWKVLQGLTTLSISVMDKQFREGLGHLRFLTDLAIEKCDGEEDLESASKALEGLSRLSVGFDEDKSYDLCKAGICYLPFLKELLVGSCKKLYLDWNGLLINTKLEKLVIYNVDNVKHVGDKVVEQHSQLRHMRVQVTRKAKWVHDIPWKSLTSLTTLSLSAIEELEALPDGIQHLSSLQFLFINGCEKVRSFPKWVPLLVPSSILLLEIEGCPLLEQASPELCSMFKLFNGDEHYEHYKLYKGYEDFFDGAQVTKAIKERQRKKGIFVELENLN